MTRRPATATLFGLLVGLILVGGSAFLASGVGAATPTATASPPSAAARASYSYDTRAARTTGTFDVRTAAPVAERAPSGVPQPSISSESARRAAKAGSKLIEGARYPLSPKIQGQLGKRGWTTEAIDEAVQSGKQVRAVNKATGNPATRYTHPKTGQSVVSDDVTGQVIHVGGPGFKYGPSSGDLP